MSILNELKNYLENETPQRREEVEAMVRTLMSENVSLLSPELSPDLPAAAAPTTRVLSPAPAGGISAPLPVNMTIVSSITNPKAQRWCRTSTRSVSS